MHVWGGPSLVSLHDMNTNLALKQVIKRHGEEINAAALESMIYLGVVIKESLRVLPISAGSFRRARKTFPLQKYSIEKVCATCQGGACNTWSNGHGNISRDIRISKGLGVQVHQLISIGGWNGVISIYLSIYSGGRSQIPPHIPPIYMLISIAPSLRTGNMWFLLFILLVPSFQACWKSQLFSIFVLTSVCCKWTSKSSCPCYSGVLSTGERYGLCSKAGAFSKSYLSVGKSLLISCELVGDIGVASPLLWLLSLTAW
jgi:hypothetical protein